MKKDLERYIGELKALPTAPGVLVRLVSLFQKPDRDIDEVAGLIRQEPSLAAGVLRHANSASFGPEEPIGDVHDAIAWIGFGQVYQAVLTKLASQSLQLPKGTCGIDADQLWQHSAIAGVCAGAIAKRVQENESMAFTAGLLHDIGKVVLTMADGSAHGKLIKLAGSEGLLLDGAEATFFGFGHAEIGGGLLHLWGLPEEIWKPVKFHHQAYRSHSHERICAVVSLGNIMAHAAVQADSKDHYVSQEAVRAMDMLQLVENDLAMLLRNSQDDIRQMAESLSPAGPGDSSGNVKNA